MSEFEQNLEQLLKQAAVQSLLYKNNQDDERHAKTALFARKLLQREYVIGFAGHFSAGKSSMINALSGEDLLAASPIPTSANIVKVHKADEDYAIVYMHNDKPVKFEAGYEYKTVKELSKNGDLVQMIEIGHAGSNLPDGVTVMDTPGVDSTDDAHAMSTESALHIADIVFYTMDYNHVQSELNFQFTKQLMKYNPNVYLIVNQIDKHKDNELSFEDFKQSVHQSFAAWGVEPKAIFFTSLKQKDHPHNDFETVKKIVMDSMDDWQGELVKTAANTLTKLQDEHTAYLTAEKEQIIMDSTDVVFEDDWKHRDDLLGQYHKLTQQKDLLNVDEWIERFEDARKELLADTKSVIIPAHFRDLLRDYLESKQPDFKVGGFLGNLFGGKGKKEEEIARRGAEVEKSYQHVTSQQVTGHLKGLMKQALRDVGALTEERSAQIDAIAYVPTLSLIDAQIQPGTGIAGDALLNFANRVAEATNRFYIEQSDVWKKEMAAELQNMATEVSGPVKKKIEAMQEKIDAIQGVVDVENRLAASALMMHQVSNENRAESKLILERWEREYARALAEIRLFDESMLKPKEQQEVLEEQVERAPIATLAVDEVVSRAMHTANLVKDVHGFTEVAEYLTKKVERLEKRDFTIALFGAFSAGKSSFSNALMGSKVLPVSPNPTTAAINKIRPVSPDCPHETADVVLKTKEDMLADIQASYAAIGLTISSLEEAYSRAQEGLAVKLTDERLNVHKSFIRAYEQGYNEFMPKLGTTIRANREDFEKFVAQENRSCFVDNIDFYYDSPITRMGVTLVDTPGADSINARHTGVAFDYIRNADAILFITYYNHAFAKADREFLIQLGRVKDAFELDKMFFIVNAIDLASNEAEAEDVKGYVRTELQRFGIRFPRLYGVSSLQALNEKVDSADYNSGMKPFESAFHSFLNDELRALAVQALAEEVEKTEQRLSDLIAQTEHNLSRKEERLKELTQLEQDVEKYYRVPKTAMLESDTKQELDELLYYLLQRVYYRYPDFFRESYNPATFAHQPAQQALEVALKEVLQSLSFDLAQELRVTNFRLAQYVQRSLLMLYKENVQNLKEKNNSFSFLGYEAEEPSLLDFTGPFQSEVPYVSVKSHFKNTKAFFEKNEKENLRDALEKLTKPDAEKFLNMEKERLLQWAFAYVAQEADRQANYLVDQAKEQIATERMLLQEESQLQSWKDIYTQLQHA
ncbi:dynamin family protein [Caryophanon tenue]|uniref:GTPase n=1 Tax=Caryophanon tenue TaxID=33978 RepID=A0A1C0Y5D7_9BACL|nr:dynamin family protein [Caryophanon tenue]OCS82345.1 GTPase [Caryophanon tenue]